MNDEIVEAMELFRGLLHDDAQKETALAMREMLCDWSEDEWAGMDNDQRQNWLLRYLPR